MNLPTKDRRITYDSGNTSLQWRCHLHGLYQPASMALFGLLMLTIFVINHQLTSVTVMAIFVLSWFSSAAIASVSRGRQKRICSTSVGPAGVTDETPDGTKTVPWSRIKSVEISNGDIYFYFGLSGAFVPRNAFATDDDAIEFYRTALHFRNAGVNHAPQIHAASTTADEILVDDLHEHDEAQWLELEKKHKTPPESR